MNSLPNFPTDRSVKFITILLLAIYGLVLLKSTDLTETYTKAKNELHTLMIEYPNKNDSIENEINRTTKEYRIALVILLAISGVLGYFFFEQLNKWRKQDKNLDKAQDLDLKLKQAELDLRRLEIKKLKQEFESKSDEK